VRRVRRGGVLKSLSLTGPTIVAIQEFCDLP